MQLLKKDRGTFRREYHGKSTGRVLIPARLVNDSQFPLSRGDIDIILYSDRVVLRQRESDKGC